MNSLQEILDLVDIFGLKPAYFTFHTNGNLNDACWCSLQFWDSEDVERLAGIPYPITLERMKDAISQLYKGGPPSTPQEPNCSYQVQIDIPDVPSEDEQRPISIEVHSINGFDEMYIFPEELSDEKRSATFLFNTVEELKVGPGTEDDEDGEC